MVDIPELFGSMVFNESVMAERLPKDTYTSLKMTIEESRPLDRSVAETVAEAMKCWAIEKGATHYTHWFQPMTGITAEKHDSFMTPLPDGRAIMEFSGKALIQGEPDASSFPSGGLRATFEARGYTAWDPTSYAFVKDGTLYIPTAFCSYGGETLDKKTPLLRSEKAINIQAKRILALFGHDVKRVCTNVGAEQEYFLVDRNAYNKRKDLIYTGRTLFGARPPKGQELDDHYFGTFKLRVADFMRDLDRELWALGIPAKTEHNEAAPAQHELACVYSHTNTACDHNQLIMSTMRRVAKRHKLTCLLHEKPFKGVNGSGKHNNWSISTDGGVNLLDPGSTPAENAQFLTFFCAVIKAVDEYQELLRVSVATAGNDHRLGASEAPPAIVSIYIGDELEAILNSIEKDETYDGVDAGEFELGLNVLPSFPKDTTDRNRTSPIAFTGNKFELRMLGSSISIAGPNTVLNTIVAEALRQFADELEGAENFNSALRGVIRRTIKEHKRIIFNGNGYDSAWHEEAKRRGLSNIASTAEAIPHMLDRKNVEVLTRHGIYTEKELASRCEIQLGAYIKNVNIEARTMLDMAKTDILPAVIQYEGTLAGTLCAKKGLASGVACRAETELLDKIATLADEFYDRTCALENACSEAEKLGGDQRALAMYFRNNICSAMENLRETGDKLEVLVGGKYWPYPSYGTLLYRV